VPEKRAAEWKIAAITNDQPINPLMPTVTIHVGIGLSRHL